MMHDPRSLIALLASVIPEDAQEADSLQQMRAFALTLADPFSRHQPDAHFTGSALVVDESAGRIALVHHAKLNRWLQPGGHAEAQDGGEMHLTALREAREETGCEVSFYRNRLTPIDVDVHLIPARGAENAHLHLDLRFLFLAENPEALTFDQSESLGARWVSLDEALTLITEPPLRRLIGKGQRIIGRH